VAFQKEMDIEMFCYSPSMTSGCTTARMATSPSPSFQGPWVWEQGAWEHSASCVSSKTQVYLLRASGVQMTSAGDCTAACWKSLRA